MDLEILQRLIKEFTYEFIDFKNPIGEKQTPRNYYRPPCRKDIVITQKCVKI